MYVIECMQDAGKEDYLRPSERIGLDWIGLEYKAGTGAAVGPVRLVIFSVKIHRK